MCVWGEGVAAEVPGQVPAGAALPRGGVCVGGRGVLGAPPGSPVAAGPGAWVVGGGRSAAAALGLGFVWDR